MKRLFAILLTLLLLLPLAQAQQTDTFVYHAPIVGKQPFADVPVLAQPPFEEGADLLRVDFINVKIGDAILIRFGNESIMIDGGTRGKAAMLELFFKDQGITGFTYYFNTHSHDDHIGASTRLVQLGYGAQEYLAKHSPLAKVADITTLYKALEQKGIPYRQVFTGDTLKLGEAELTFFQNEREGQEHGINARSMMVHVRYGERSLLLPADVTGVSLGQMMDDYPDLMDVDIMKSPHHGINRLRHEFLVQTAPELFVITSNLAGGETLAKQLRDQKIAHYFISQGTVSLSTDGKLWYVEQKK